MTVDFTQPVLVMPDGSYVVTLSNGMSYNALQVDPLCQWPNLWPDVQAWLAAGNVAQPYVPPATVPPTIQQQLAVLDAVVSRDVEDWYAENGKTPPYGPRADAIKQKQALRAQLAQTQGGA